MKKDQLIGIHRLLNLILEKAKSNSNMDIDESFDMKEYNELGIKPTAVHKTNDNHKEAILELSRRLSQGIEEHGDEIEIINDEGESVSVSEMKQTRDRAKEVANTSTGLDPKKSEDNQEEDNPSTESGPDWGKMG